MNGKLNIFEFDDEPLFISLSIFKFLISNLSVIHGKFNYDDLLKNYESSEQFSDRKNEKFAIDKLQALFVQFRLINDDKEFFYNLGNKENRFHFQVAGYLNYFISKAETSNWGSDGIQNIAQIQMMLKQETISLRINFHKSIKENHENIITPLTHLLKGFFDRIAFIVFDCTILEKQTHKALIKEFEVRHFIEAPSKLIEYVPLKQVMYYKFKKCITGDSNMDLSEQITSLLVRDLGFTIEEISKNLNTSVRSLQRNLKDQDQKFSTIKEDVRKELSVKHLENLELSIEEVSDLLGYSERSAFDRAFKKWFGINAKIYRDKLARH